MRLRGVTVMTNTPPRSAAERAGRHAGHHDHGADRREGGAQAGHRSGGHPPHQLLRRARRRSVPPIRGKRALRDQRIRQGSARPWRGGVQVERENARAKPEAHRYQGARRRRGHELLMSAARSVSTGFLLIKPDGRICFQSGIGNLGTESVIDVHRVGAEMLGVPWEKCDVCWGTNSKNLPWTCVSGGSQTTHAMTRAAHAVAMEAKTAAAGDRREESGRQARELRSRQRARVPQRRRRRHDSGAGRAKSHSAGRHLRRS